MTLYLFDFANYYNRTSHRFNTIEEYKRYRPSNSKGLLMQYENINFNPNDEIKTTQIINYYDLTNKPNYIIIADEEDKIISRWYIISSRRTREGQFELNLYRDLIADWYDKIKNVPMFVEKAIVNDLDPAIYNSENMTYNQIKKDEFYIKNSPTAWLCGYIANGKSSNLKIEIDDKDEYYDEVVNTKYEDWEYYNTIKSGKINICNTSNNVYYGDVIHFNNIFNSTDLSAAFSYLNKKGVQEEFILDVGTAGTVGGNQNFYDTISLLIYGEKGRVDANILSTFNFDDENEEETLNGIYKAFKEYGKEEGKEEEDGFDKLNNVLKDFIKYISLDKYNELYKKYNNKIIKFTDGNAANTKFIKLSFGNYIDSDSEDYDYIRSDGYSVKSVLAEGNLYSTLVNIQKNIPYYRDYSNTKNTFYASVAFLTRSVNIEYIQFDTYSVEAEDVDSVDILEDAPYIMFCIPYSINSVNINIPRIDNINGESVELQSKVSLMIAQEYIKNGTNTWLYDLQLLPFNPLSLENQYTDQNITYYKHLGNKRSAYIYRKETPESVEKTPVSIIYFARKSSFTDVVDFNFEIDNLKIDSETKKVRLCSPNYNGTFEFNPAMNKGITSFYIGCTYKPYTPYIHVYPNFDGLYGKNFQDARGLICGGDFSLTMMSDAWQQYQIQNKNYENIFNLNIKDMTLKNNIQAEKEYMNIIMKGIQGTISAGKSFITGGIGSGINNLINTSLSQYSSSYNYELNEILRNQAINYATDLYGYQLGNIQALPQSISKTTSFTYNNKIFPIVEIYDCTDEEKIALANKIKYNGMTVMRIGTINEFINNSWVYTPKNLKYNTIAVTKKNGYYFKAKLIRTSEIQGSFEVINALADELNKGVYLWRTT